ncbi:MAG: LVIVD repeat-containing protein [Salibacteraceae bacterium]
MKNWILLLGCFLGAATAATTFGQLPNKNLNLIGSLSYTQNLSDVWGYVDETGIEYALVGTTNGFSVVSLEDPTNPVEVFYTGGFPTVWRDIKVWNDRAYVTNEGGGGLTIVDLRPLPLGNNLPVYNYVGQNVPFNTAHNLYIDNGVAYLFGVDGTPHGALYLDLSDPDNPTEMGSFDQFYGHDGYVRDNTMYIAHIDDGFFGIYDISNMPTTNSLQTRGTPSSTSHNIWPSDDNQYVFTTDEVAAGYIAAYDISDLSNIEEVDRYQSRPGSGVYPHNVHYYNGYLVISYYADGLIILDVTRPSNMVEVGRYDTSPNFSGDQNDGCWGAYP